jgi:hypothetical protein
MMDTASDYTGENPQATIEAAAAILAPIFAANEWRWSMCGVPTERDLRNKLTYLYHNAQGHHHAETGRLAVHRDPYEKGRLRLFLDLGSIYHKE